MLLAAADERARRAAVDFAVSRGHAEVEEKEKEEGEGYMPNKLHCLVDENGER